MSKSAMDLVQAAKAVINEITVEQAQEMLANECLFLDVREQSEFDEGHILHAKHISRGMLEFKISVHPDFKDMAQPVVVYCKTGGRSALATQTLMSLGFTNISSMLGGFDAWTTTHTPSQA
jgi:rhodanese-related sulfurtransferase